MRSPTSIFRRLSFALGATLIVACLTLLVFELICAAASSIAGSLHPDPVRPEASPAYSSADWVAELYREQSARLAEPYLYLPFTVTGVTPWHGRYFNNDEHATGVWRRTDNPNRAHCPQPKMIVWVFGGSTVYGTGVPDSATLPSYLSHALNRDLQVCVEVTNFGDESFATNQEVILLSQQLKRGGKPDIVIFYDGFNDSHIGMSAADPSSTHYGFEIVKARTEGSFRGRLDFARRLYTVRLLNAAWQLLKRTKAEPNFDEIKSDEMKTRAAKVLDNYQGNHQLAAALGQAYKFKFYGIWQPMLFYGNKPLNSFEQQLRQLDNSERRRFDPRPVEAAYQEAEKRAPRAGFLFLANVFDHATEPIYIDEAHLGAGGNKLVAEAIAKYVRVSRSSEGQSADR